MIVTTLFNLVNSAKVILSISEYPLDMVRSRKLIKLRQKAQQELEIYDKVRNDAVMKYGEKQEIDGNPNFYKFTPENQALFEGEIKVLHDTMISFDIDPIPLSALPDLKMGSLGLEALLKWLLVDDLDAKEEAAA